MFTFRKPYFFLALLLFLIEAYIGLYLRDAFVRPYVGDYLVVIFLYCFIRAFLRASVIPVALFVLATAFVVEILQYFHFIEVIGLQHSTLAHLVLGSGFEWIDLLAYTLGVGTVLLMEAGSRTKASGNGAADRLAR
ncbi:MAG TPA: DUF2809 domain-containing protein [Chitinophagaceae bacterium]|jgi:hypothetical protein|nr:DUF2809 domain-containing protein [Chitinophagaceae bacterium]